MIHMNHAERLLAAKHGLYNVQHADLTSSPQCGPQNPQGAYWHRLLHVSDPIRSENRIEAKNDCNGRSPQRRNYL